jgi:hypothetical protein
MLGATYRTARHINSAEWNRFWRERLLDGSAFPCAVLIYKQIIG